MEQPITDIPSLANLLDAIVKEGHLEPTDSYGLAAEAVLRMTATERRDMLTILVTSVAQRYVVRLPTKRVETRHKRPARDRHIHPQRRAWLNTPEGQAFAESARRRDELEAKTITEIGQSAYYERQLTRFNDRLAARIRTITITDLLSEELRACNVSTERGESSPWGELTKQQHEDRIEYLSRQVDGDLHPIVQHIAATALLARYGCDTINTVSDLLDRQIGGDAV